MVIRFSRIDLREDINENTIIFSSSERIKIWIDVPVEAMHFFRIKSVDLDVLITNMLYFVKILQVSD